MRIVVVSGAYSSGMGYTENCLPKALGRLGHDVHLVTSQYNVYGASPVYRTTYEKYLGAPKVSVGVCGADDYVVHRLPSGRVGSHIYIRNLEPVVRRLAPDVVQVTSVVSLVAFGLALAPRKLRYPLFAECHQHLSVVRPYLVGGSRLDPRRLYHCLTRRVPGMFCGERIEKCYAISDDCAEVAATIYGIPRGKTEVLPLGTDTDLFSPPTSDPDREVRQSLRAALGVSTGGVLCVYTGRLTEAKNPLLLGQAIHTLRARGMAYSAAFVGAGPQKAAIEALDGCTTIPFRRHDQLAAYYRAADIGVWPREESMSMLDASSCGLPLVYSDRMGSAASLAGCGLPYSEGDPVSLTQRLVELKAAAMRTALGQRGAERARLLSSWRANATKRVGDYEAALASWG